MTLKEFLNSFKEDSNFLFSIHDPYSPSALGTVLLNEESLQIVKSIPEKILNRRIYMVDCTCKNELFIKLSEISLSDRMIKDEITGKVYLKEIKYNEPITTNSSI